MVKWSYLENYWTDFKKSLQLRIQRPWFQDNFFIKYQELFFVKIFSAKWNSYLYAQYIEFFLL